MGLAPREMAPGREVKDEYDPSISGNTQEFRVGSRDAVMRRFALHGRMTFLHSMEH